jgi:hypothetical protein
MRTQRLFISGMVLLLMSSRVSAQTYTIKTKEYPDVGKSTHVVQTSTNRFALTISLGEKVLKQEKRVEVEERRYVEKVLALNAAKDKPAKYSHSFSKAVKGPKEAPANLLYAGKTVVFELMGEAYKVTSEGGVTEKDIAEFTKRANKPKMDQWVYAEKPVQVGESWKLSQKAIKVMMEDAPDDAIDMKSLVATGKLLKAYKKNGRQWGVIEITAKGLAKKLGPLPLSKPIDFETKITLDTAIDGSTTAGEMKGIISFKGKSDFKQGEMTFVLDIDANNEIRQTQSAEK